MCGTVDVLGCSDVKTRAVVPWRGSPRGTESYSLSGPGHLPRGPAQMPTCLDGTRAATLWRGLSRRTNSTHSPAPDACPVARLDLRKTGRKQQDSGRRGRRLLAPQPRDGARAGSPEPQARRCPLARTPHSNTTPHCGSPAHTCLSPGSALAHIVPLLPLAIRARAPRRGDRSPLVVTGHAERPPDFVSAVTHRGFARIGRLPTPALLKRPTKSEHVVAA